MDSFCLFQDSKYAKALNMPRLHRMLNIIEYVWICLNIARIYVNILTAWKVPKYGVFSGPYFPVFGLNTGKYGLEKTPYLDTFHVVSWLSPKYTWIYSQYDRLLNNPKVKCIQRRISTWKKLSFEYARVLNMP